jgi:hypothetical protein
MAQSSVPCEPSRLAFLRGLTPETRLVYNSGQGFAWTREGRISQHFPNSWEAVNARHAGGLVWEYVPDYCV